MERLTRAAGGLGLVCLFLVGGACDCEEKLREAVSRDNVKKYFDDTDGSTGPREEEPNDVPQQASLIELGERLRTARGTVEARGDRDWFALKAGEETGGLVTMSVEPLNDSLDLSVQVEIEPSDSERITYDTAEAGEPEVVRSLDLGGDVRRVAVRGRGGTTGTYEIQFERRLTQGAVEREPNDVRSAATRYEFPGSVEGMYGRKGDVDWYHVIRQDVEAGVYRLDVEPTGSFPQTVEFFTRREADEPYLTAQVPPKEPLEIPNVRIPEELDGVWIRLSAGREYAPDAAYRLRMIEHPAESKRTVEAEPNDGKKDSIGLELGEVVGGYLHSPSDLDRFHLAVGRELPENSVDAGGPGAAGDASTGGGDRAPDTGVEEPVDAGSAPDGPRARLPDKERPEHVVQIGLKPLSDSERLTLVWWPGAWDGERKNRTAANAGEAVKICNHAMDRGLVRLGVRGAELEERSLEGGFTYELAAVDISRKVDGLEVEPNDFRDRADRLTFGTVRTGYISRSDDRDFYAFAVPRHSRPADPATVRPSEGDASGGTRPRGGRRRRASKSVTIRLEGNELNLGFDVLDSQGALVAEVDRNGAGSNESVGLDLPPGLYYVRVSSKRDGVCKPYRLRLRRNDSPGDAGP